MTARTYLDWNATSPVRPAVAELVARVLRETGNASSVHAEGRAARARIEKARRQVAGLIGARESEIVFTGSGTEANNAVLRMPQWQRVLVSAVEHDSVRLARPDAASVPVSRQGVVDCDRLKAALVAGDGPTLVAVMLANNETGVVQPITGIARIVHEAGAFLHVDAVQAAGRIAIDCRELGADYLALSAHKIGALHGVGCVVLHGSAPFISLMLGGGQERGRRAGTENVAGIAAFGLAAELAAQETGNMPRVAGLRDRFEAACRATRPELPIHGEGTTRLPNTSCIGMPGVSAQLQLMAFDLAGIAVSAGSACSSGKVRPSHVLASMACNGRSIDEAIRVSIGVTTTERDIERLIAAWRDIAVRSRAGTPDAVAA